MKTELTIEAPAQAQPIPQPPIDLIRVIALDQAQLSASRDAVVKAIRMTLNEGVEGEEAVIFRVLQALRSGKLLAWGIFAKGDDGKAKMVGVAMTEEYVDRWCGRKVLSISSLAANERISDGAWTSFVQTLMAHAKKAGCKTLIAQSGNARVHQLCEAKGFQESQRLYVKGVE